jgi:hypothetical protein
MRGRVETAETTVPVESLAEVVYKIGGRLRAHRLFEGGIVSYVK